MTSSEFILWLKGFTDGVHEYNITPKQWDLLKDKLAEVGDESKAVYPFGVPNLNPNGTARLNPAITTTPGYSSITFPSGSANWICTTTNDKTLLND
jgi:hypothetical protein